jgi:ADP-ribose pyrophosphatase YjhB (NUDIX family)
VSSNHASRGRHHLRQEGKIHKVSGGGVEANEDPKEAAQREVQEGTGALVAIRDYGCVATTEEYRNDLHQLSH